jgi:hypothetical protein
MFFSRFEYHMFYVLYQLMTYLMTLPRYLVDTFIWLACHELMITLRHTSGTTRLNRRLGNGEPTCLYNTMVIQNFPASRIGWTGSVARTPMSTDLTAADLSYGASCVALQTHVICDLLFSGPGNLIYRHLEGLLSWEFSTSQGRTINRSS